MKARAVGIASSLVVGTAAVLGAQAVYTARRRDLPTVIGADASGFEGDPAHHVVRVAAAGDSTLTGPRSRRPRRRVVAAGVAQARRRASTALRVAVLRRRRRHGWPMSYAINSARCSRPVPISRSSWSARTTPSASRRSVTSARRAPASSSELAGEVPNVLIGGVGDLANIARLRWPLAGALRLRGRAVDGIIRHTVARHDNVHYVDVSLADPDFRRGGASLFAADLFHPNRDGHALWAAVSRDRVRTSAHRNGSARIAGSLDARVVGIRSSQSSWHARAVSRRDDHAAIGP